VLDGCLGARWVGARGLWNGVENQELVPGVIMPAAVHARQLHTTLFSALIFEHAGGSDAALLLRPLPLCSAGLQAIAEVAASIRAGYYTIGIAGGVSSFRSAHVLPSCATVLPCI